MQPIKVFPTQVMQELCSLASLVFLLFTANVRAAETVSLEKVGPLRDASVCAAPDGKYYLTGAIATVLPSEKTASFLNCRGVQVWESSDLKAWKDLGLVWDLWKDPTQGVDTVGSRWQSELMPYPGLASGDRVRGMTAPRLAHDGKRFWIAYSMNGYAAGALPGGTDVKGPYKDTRLLAEAGGSPTGKSDASIFVDLDSTPYLVWGGGCVAKLKSPEDLEKLKAGDVGIEGAVSYLPSRMEGFLGEDGLPDRGAPYGAFLFHDGKKYVFLFTATTLQGGAVHEDVYLSRSDKLDGPYSKPEIILQDTGRCSAFRGPGGQTFLAYSNSKDQPVILPMPNAPAQVQPGSAPAPAVGQIAEKVPARKVNDKPKDVPQLIEFIAPCLENPLKDAAIGRGPDGTWYMVGTEGVAAGEQAIDWSRNKGIRLWKSRDRAQWTDLGYVWDIQRDAVKSPKSAWQMAGHLDLTCGAKPRIGRAIAAPEVHFVKNTFLITYSMNGSGIGLLKSTTGKAEGPYEDMGKLIAHARDASLFEEGGTVYLVWGEGFCAKLKEDFSGVEGPVRTLFANVAWYPREMRRPELIGQWGSRLVKQDDWYLWTFTTRTGRGGINAIDTMASWSKSLDGPWGEPCLMLMDGGQSTLVPDGNGGWLATVSGEEEYSQCPFQAAITPVVSGGKGANPKPGKLALAPYNATASVSQWFAVNALMETSLDLWIGYPDFTRTEARDVFVMYDGTFYYHTGTLWGSEGKYRLNVTLFRSRDLVHWEETPCIYPYAQIKEDGLVAAADIPKFDAMIAKAKEGKRGLNEINVGEGKFFKTNGTYYELFFNCGKWPGMVLIESQSGTPEGPYKGIRNMPFCDVMLDKDGAFFIVTPKPALARYDSFKAYLSTPQGSENKQLQSLKYNALPNICFWEDCETGMKRIADKYVYWTTDWTGNYDGSYVFADDWKGEWHGHLRILPHAGNSQLFQDKDGNWWVAYFRTSNAVSARTQVYCRLNFYPLDVYECDGDLILEPKAMRTNRKRIEQMGALWHAPTGKE